MTVLLYALPLAIVGSVVLAARLSLMVVHVHGQSMEPTLHEGDRVIAKRVRRAAPATGQMVVVQQPPPWRTIDSWRDGRLVAAEGFWLAGRPVPSKRWMIKRVVATEGEPLPPEFQAWREALGVVVPAGHLLVLGDNRNRSMDSRRFGFVSVDSVLGVLVRN